EIATSHCLRSAEFFDLGEGLQFSRTQALRAMPSRAYFSSRQPAALDSFSFRSVALPKTTSRALFGSSLLPLVPQAHRFYPTNASTNKTWRDAVNEVAFEGRRA